MRRLLALLLLAAVAAPAAAEEALWQALADGGHVAVLRHADAPGTGDPAGFTLADCATQRTLGDAGRAQATALGDRFRAEGVAVGAVLSSAWCRCLDTARLMALGDPAVEPALNSLYGGQGDRPRQLAALTALVAAWEGPSTLLLVSHASVIGPLTGVYPREGEIVVLAPAPGSDAGFQVLGSLPPAS